MEFNTCIICSRSAVLFNCGRSLERIYTKSSLIDINFLNGLDDQTVSRFVFHAAFLPMNLGFCDH